MDAIIVSAVELVWRLYPADGEGFWDPPFAKALAKFERMSDPDRLRVFQDVFAKLRAELPYLAESQSFADTEREILQLEEACRFLSDRINGARS